MIYLGMCRNAEYDTLGVELKEHNMPPSAYGLQSGTLLLLLYRTNLRKN
jgi:hypothetical protein